MSKLGIAAIQLAGEKHNNFDLFEREVRAIARRFPWVSLVTVGELALHGASIDAAEEANGPTETRLKELAAELGLWLVPGSLYEKRDGKIYNMTPVINPEGEIIARHDKLFPFLPYEKNVASGSTYCVFDIPGVGRLGVAICYDMWFPEVIRTLAGMGAEAILLPTMTNTIDRDVEVSIARANAAINQCYFIDVNVAGAQGNGRSVFYGPGGELLHECGSGRDVVTLELDFEQVRNARERGWHGLGQVLKSFRDTPVEFPFHSSHRHRSEEMAHLGPLKLPTANALSEKSETNFGGEKHKLKVVE